VHITGHRTMASLEDVHRAVPGLVDLITEHHLDRMDEMKKPRKR
jgi:hypothetical protein